jgi:predicted unusual protein kinase regulating ubiquinone biosynthesis (AarF/ABC1/UbiB family)
LAENRILHVDLHPGNILVDTRPQVYIIDFDKAVTTAYHSSKLRQRYIRRWRRAVIKHELPLFLHEEFQTALG